MDGIPLALLFLISWVLVFTYAHVAQMVTHAMVFALVVLTAMASLPAGTAQLVPWTVLLAAAARSGRLLVVRQQQEAM